MCYVYILFEGNIYMCDLLAIKKESKCACTTTAYLTPQQSIYSIYYLKFKDTRISESSGNVLSNVRRLTS